MITTRELPEKGKDFIDAMVPMLESLVDFDSYGYEHYLKEGSFHPDPTIQQMMGNFEERRVRGIPENILLELLKKYPQVGFARKKRKELGYENPDIF